MVAYGKINSRLSPSNQITLISPLAVPSAHVRTAPGHRSRHTTFITAGRGRYGTAELTLAIAASFKVCFLLKLWVGTLDRCSSL